MGSVKRALVATAYVLGRQRFSCAAHFGDRKGENIEEFPPDLRVRKYPKTV
jgi:hypothetical protein